MRLTITTKQFQVIDNDHRYIEKLVKKLERFSPWKDLDYPHLDIILRKHKKKSLDHTQDKLVSEDSVLPLHGHETVDNPVYYDGVLNLILPKKRLVATMLGETVQMAVKDGFDELFRELDKYKGLHFANDSKYDTHRTMRQK
jgi:ribosome-associated translation inhibitor RaiA